MRANRVTAYVFAAAASLAGCMGTGEVEYAGSVHVSSPELVAISPGVQVVADADEPLFYADGYYWLYRDGYWLRSDDYRRNFVRVELSYVPQRVRTIERPQTYAQYRRHHRDYSARANPQPTRSRPAGTFTPPPHQGVPSTPPPETWQPNPINPNAPSGVNPVPSRPQPTPPITSPGDVHGNPMPGNAPPVNVERSNRPGPQPLPPPHNREDSGGTDRDDQATPPSPPGQGHSAKDEEQGRKQEEQNKNDRHRKHDY